MFLIFFFDCVSTAAGASSLTSTVSPTNRAYTFDSLSDASEFSSPDRPTFRLNTIPLRSTAAHFGAIVIEFSRNSSPVANPNDFVSLSTSFGSDRFAYSSPISYTSERRLPGTRPFSSSSSKLSKKL
uniref:Putative secreted protein n=1 Tax=Anopheles darlingi TaxID=43151 RepID=A0A2M4DIW0_ANODA